jgi:Domain of unknown function (DUF202)
MTRDPGLQPERTALSWQRTGVAALLVGGGAAAAAVHRGEPLVVVAALAVLALAGVTAIPPRLPPADHGGKATGVDHAPRGSYARLVRAAVATVALAGVGVLLALT